MKPIIHALAGTIALLCVTVFWTATVIAEVFGDHPTVALVKQDIVYGLFLLVPAMVITGLLGFSLSRTRPGSLVLGKIRRMRLIAANGILIMVPCALFLNHQAQAGAFDVQFYAVQALELLVGGIQLTLMSRNFRDGLRLAQK